MSTSSPGWCPSWPAGTTSSPSARTSEVEHPGATGQRRGDHGAADHAQAHPHPVVHAERGGQLAGQPGPGPRAAARRRALQFGQQRLGEDVEGQRGGHRVARRAQHRCAVHHAEHHRVTRPHRDAVDRQRAELGHDLGGVVVPASARPGDDDKQIAGGDGRARPPWPARPGRPARSAARAPRSRPRGPGRSASASWCRGSRRGRSACRPAAPRPRWAARLPPAGGGRAVRVAPAAAAAATSTARSRCPSGSSSSAVLTSSPIDRTCW